MELKRRSLVVYGLLAAVWALVLGWQVEEHVRVKEAARTDLRNRSKDIANTLSAIIRGHAVPGRSDSAGTPRAGAQRTGPAAAPTSSSNPAS